jgi:WD40 repeat protein
VSVAFLAQGTTLLTADRDGLVQRWDIPGGTGGQSFGVKWVGLQQVVCSSDGKYMVRCGDNSFREPALQVARANTGKELWSVRHEQPPEDLRGEGRTGFRLVYWSAAFSGSGRFLASSECMQRQRNGSLSRHIIRLWEVATGKEVLKIEGFPHVATALAFSPDGNLLVSTHGQERGHPSYPVSDAFGGAAAPEDQPTLRFWDLRTGQEVGRLRGHLCWSTGVVFSPDGRRLISAGADHTALVWDVPGLRRLQFSGTGAR